MPKICYNACMNVEIYNYLNLINFKLAKLYKKGLYNPFPVDFEVSENDFKERLIFSQIENKLPDFVFEEKRKIKKYFKNSKKNIKKILKNLKKNEFLSVFDEKIINYLNLRLKLTKCLLHDFKNQDFNESDAVLDVFKLDPIFAEHFLDLFNEDCDIENLLNDLETKYKLTYLQKTKLIEKKNNQKAKKNAVELSKKTVSKSKNLKKTEKIIKKPEKIEEKTIKTAKTQSKNQKQSEKTAVKKTTTKNKELS